VKKNQKPPKPEEDDTIEARGAVGPLAEDIRDLSLEIDALRPLARKATALSEGGRKGAAARRDRALQRADRDEYRAKARTIRAAEPHISIKATVERLGTGGYTQRTCEDWIRDLWSSR
jgi:hypothetical protein